MKYKLAIGDIHGRLDMLETLIKFVDENVDAPYQKIFLGDYIDRGHNSKGVLDYVRKCKKNGDIVLPGNHERMFVEACDGGNPDRTFYRTFMANGGVETLKSFGVKNISDVPVEYINFIRNELLDKNNLYYKDKFRIFVHAGIHSKMDYYKVENLEDILLWVRYPETYTYDNQEFLVVHGHTPTGRIFYRNNRLNIDTGAVYGRYLSAALFGDDKKEPLKFFQINNQFITKELIPSQI